MTSMLQSMLFLYIWSLSLIQRLLRQTKKTAGLLVNSFSEETLYFVDSELPVIVSKASTLTTDIESACWSFSDNGFRYMTETPAKKLPYLSATLYKDDVFFSDLSDWFQEVSFVSQVDPPLRFVVFVWAYQNKIVLDSYLTSKYTLHVITIDGDEMELNMKTA